MLVERLTLSLHSKEDLTSNSVQALVFSGLFHNTKTCRFIGNSETFFHQPCKMSPASCDPAKDCGFNTGFRCIDYESTHTRQSVLCPSTFDPQSPVCLSSVSASYPAQA